MDKTDHKGWEWQNSLFKGILHSCDRKKKQTPKQKKQKNRNMVWYKCRLRLPFINMFALACCRDVAKIKRRGVPVNLFVKLLFLLLFIVLLFWGLQNSHFINHILEINPSPVPDNPFGDPSHQTNISPLIHNIATSRKAHRNSYLRYRSLW